MLKNILLSIAFVSMIFFISGLDSVRLWWIQGSALPEINILNYAGDQITVGGVSFEGPGKINYILLWSVEDENSIEALKQAQVLMNKSVIYASQFYAVNIDSIENKKKSAAVVDENEFSFKLLLDFEKKISQEIKFQKTPLLLALSHQGVVIYATNKFDDSLEKTIKDINLNF